MLPDLHCQSVNDTGRRIGFCSGSWPLTLLPVQGDDIINVAPKKANWDLRRDVAKGLEKLERRTKRALVAIMQEQQQQPLHEDGAQVS